MQEALQVLHEEPQLLRNVAGVVSQTDEPSDQAMLLAIVLAFETCRVAVVAQADDSIDIRSAEGLVEACDIDLSAVSPWNQAIGKPLMWSWTMTNQQGYFDGLQLEFAEHSGAEAVVVQAICIGSELKIRAISTEYSDWALGYRNSR